MLKPLPDLISKYNLNINGVIHIGGHKGQEYPYYKTAGIKNIIFIEPHPTTFGILKNNVGKECTLFNTALGNTEGTMEMYCEEANEGQSNSLLEPSLHRIQYPNIEFTYLIDVPITKLDNLPFDRTLFNFINIDVQGYELEVFKGSTKTIENIDYIYSEVNRDNVYEGCARVEQLDDFLHSFRFKRVETWWEGGTWGDALYVKSTI